MSLYLPYIMHIKPNKWHKNGWKYNCSHTSIIIIKIQCQKHLDQTNFKSRPSDKFVNGDTFSLLLKLSCSITFGHIDIIIVLRCGHNKKQKTYLLKPIYHIFYKSPSLHIIEFEPTYTSNK
jgi:hypothetical protein